MVKVSVSFVDPDGRRRYARAGSYCRQILTQRLCERLRRAVTQGRLSKETVCRVRIHESYLPETIQGSTETHDPVAFLEPYRSIFGIESASITHKAQIVELNKSPHRSPTGDVRVSTRTTNEMTVSPVLAKDITPFFIHTFTGINRRSVSFQWGPYTTPTRGFSSFVAFDRYREDILYNRRHNLIFKPKPVLNSWDWLNFPRRRWADL